MPDTMVDRRRSQRFPLILMAEVTNLSSSAKVSARTSDVSRTGCYIDTLHPLPAGSRIGVKLTRGTDKFEAVATVMYVSPGLGMGVAFEGEVPAEELAILDRWLEAAAKQPA